MSLKDWENKVMSSPGAAGRVAAIEDELRLAAGLTALREEAGLGVSVARVSQIQHGEVTSFEVIARYVEAPTTPTGYAQTPGQPVSVPAVTPGEPQRRTRAADRRGVALSRSLRRRHGLRGRWIYGTGCSLQLTTRCRGA
jgi:hypothetical protein